MLFSIAYRTRPTLRNTNIMQHSLYIYVYLAGSAYTLGLSWGIQAYSNSILNRVLSAQALLVTPLYNSWIKEIDWSISIIQWTTGKSTERNIIGVGLICIDIFPYCFLSSFKLPIGHIIVSTKKLVFVYLFLACDGNEVKRKRERERERGH